MKILVLLDGSNLYHMLRSRCGVIPAALDWKALPGAILRRISGANARDTTCEIRHYIGAVRRDDPESYARQQALFRKIQEAGIHSWTGHLVTRAREVRCANCREQFVPQILCPKCGRPLPSEIRVEKGVDVKIAADAVEAVATGTHDTIVIGSQDADFIPVIHAVKTLRGGAYCLTTPFPQAARGTGKIPALLSACDGAVWMTRKFLAECGVSVTKGEGA